MLLYKAVVATRQYRERAQEWFERDPTIFSVHVQLLLGNKPCMSPSWTYTRRYRFFDCNELDSNVPQSFCGNISIGLFQIQLRWCLRDDNNSPTDKRIPNANSLRLPEAGGCQSCLTPSYVVSLPKIWFPGTASGRLLETRVAPVFAERGEFCQIVMMDHVPGLGSQLNQFL